MPEIGSLENTIAVGPLKYSFNPSYGVFLEAILTRLFFATQNLAPTSLTLILSSVNSEESNFFPR